MHRFTPVLLAVFGVFSLVFIQLHSTPMASATAASTVNFQARLQSAAGAVVPDGTYNIEFKLYSGVSCNPTTGASCTVEWTEDYLNSASQGLQTINGYLSANLGSITTFPTTIKWDQQLWLSMNVGGTTTGSVSWDGAMKPYLNLTAVPAAFSANQLANTTGSGRSTLTFQGSSNGDQNFIIQDQGAGGTFNLLTANKADLSYIQLQSSTPGTAQTGNINISGTAIAGTLQGTTAVKTAAIRPISDSTTALQFQNAAGSTNIIDIDTTNNRVGIGLTAPTATLDIKGPGSDSSASALNITNAAGGAIINARDDGQVTIGTTAASGTVTTFGSMANTTHDYGDNNFFTSTKFTTGSHDGTLTSISIYIGGVDPNPANDKYRLAIYADGGANHPTTLIAQSAEGTLTASTVNTLSVTASLTANTNYWLAYQTTTTSDSSYNDFYYASAGTNQYYAYANPYGLFPSTADTGGVNASVAMAIYGTYTEAGTGTVPALTVAANGNIGIGNSSPIYPLDVTGTGNFTSSILSPQLDSTTTLSIGTGTATNITVGSTTSSSTLTLGQSTNSNTINIGNGAITATQTINIGTAATGGLGADVVSIGSYLNSSSTTIKGGTGNISLQTNNAASSVLVISNVNSTSAFQVQGTSSVSMFNVDTVNEKITIGPSGGDTTGALLILGNKTSASDPTEVDGAMYYNSNMGGFRCGVSGVWQGCIGGLLTANTNLTGDTVANTATETNFGSNWSMPANYCVAGRVLRVTAQGTWQNNNSTPTLQLKLKAGSTVIGASPVITTAAQTLGTPREWRVDFQIICDAVPGSSAAVEGQGQLTLWSGNANTGLLQEMANTNTVSVATNAAQTIQLSAAWGTADTNNTITLRQIIVEGLGP